MYIVHDINELATILKHNKIKNESIFKLVWTD